MPAGHLRLDGAYSLTRGVDERLLSCPDVALDLCANEAVPDHVRSQSFTAARFVGSAAFGLGKGLQIELSIPVELKHFTLEHRLPSGAAYAPPYATLVGATGTTVGFGDARALLRLTGRVPNSPVILGIGLGAMLPSGRVAPNPFDIAQPAADREQRQFGNGTVDPIAEGAFVLGTKPIGFLFAANVRVPLYANQFGYRGSFVVGATTGMLLAMPAPAEQLHLLLLLRASHGGAGRWDGVVAENSGRDDVSSVIGVEAMVRPGLSVRGELAASVLEIATGEQFSLPVTLSFGISGMLDLRKKLGEGEGAATP